MCRRYQPVNPLAAFDGTEAGGGDWTLTVEDMEGGHAGVFEEWTLELEVQASERDDLNPDICANEIVWSSQGQYGLLLDDGQSRRRITANTEGADSYPIVAHGMVVWEARSETTHLRSSSGAMGR